MARKQAELRPLMLRLPEDLRQKLETASHGAGRSMNAEIIERLERSFGLLGQITLCLGDSWATARLHRDELLIGVGFDSPQDTAVLTFSENLDAFKAHFGIKK